MSRIAFVLLILCIAVPCAGAQGQSGDGGLRVMSFNIRYGTADDGDNSWEHRTDTVVRMLRQCSPGIVGLQECLAFQADFLADALPEYRWLGVGREADLLGEHCAVLYKYKELAPLYTGNFWLSETPGVPGSKSWQTACTRMVTWARFYDIKRGRHFFFFNTHFDHRSAPARENSAVLLAQRVEDVRAGLPAIVTGDFNAAAEESAPWRTLTAGALADAWLAAEETAGPAVTWSGFKAPKPDGRRIDWVLFAGPFKPVHCETVIYNEDGRYPSDHFPVLAVFGSGESGASR